MVSCCRKRSFSLRKITRIINNSVRRYLQFRIEYFIFDDKKYEWDR